MGIIIVVAFCAIESGVNFMILDMRPMLRGETDRIEIDFSLAPQLPDDAKPDGDARVVGEITDRAGYMRLSLCATLQYNAQCARCLEPVHDEFSVELERTVSTRENLSEKQLEENVDEYAIIEDGKLDLGELVREELLLSFPMRFLCSPDCPGLCPKCGKPLRDGDCGCPKKEPDPRLAVLKTLLEQNEDS